MMKLYYAPGACSLATHIALEEAAVAFDSQVVALARNEQFSPEYLKINPRSRVPALMLDEGLLVESPAILDYIATRHAPHLMPKDPLAHARAISLMAWFSNTVHPAFTHVVRPDRFITDPAMIDNLKAKGRANFDAALQEIDRMLAGRQWIMGDAFSVVDGYALVFCGWAKRIDLAIGKNYTAFKDRMMARPAVSRVLEREKSILLAA